MCMGIKLTDKCRKKKKSLRNSLSEHTRKPTKCGGGELKLISTSTYGEARVKKKSVWFVFGGGKIGGVKSEETCRYSQIKKRQIWEEKTDNLKTDIKGLELSKGQGIPSETFHCAKNKDSARKGHPQRVPF